MLERKSQQSLLKCVVEEVSLWNRWSVLLMNHDVAYLSIYLPIDLLAVVFFPKVPFSSNKKADYRGRVNKTESWKVAGLQIWSIAIPLLWK